MLNGMAAWMLWSARAAWTPWSARAAWMPWSARAAWMPWSARAAWMPSYGSADLRLQCLEEMRWPPEGRLKAWIR